MPVMAGGRDEQAESEHRLEIAAYLDRVISAAGYESQAELRPSSRTRSSAA